MFFFINFIALFTFCSEVINSTLHVIDIKWFYDRRFHYPFIKNFKINNVLVMNVSLINSVHEFCSIFSTRRYYFLKVFMVSGSFITMRLSALLIFLTLTLRCKMKHSLQSYYYLAPKERGVHVYCSFILVCLSVHP